MGGPDEAQLGLEEEGRLAASFHFPDDLEQKFLTECDKPERNPLPANFARVVMRYIKDEGYLDHVLGTADSYLRHKIRQFFKQVVGTDSGRYFRMTPQQFYLEILGPHLKGFQFMIRDAFNYLEMVSGFHDRLREASQRHDTLAAQHGEVQEERNRFRAEAEGLYQVAGLDSKTGLQSLWAMKNRIDKITEEEPEEPYVYILFDLDKFKRINDTYGYLAGDEMIHQMAGLASNVGGIRFEEIARWGGDEFVLVFKNTGGRGLQLAEKLRRKVEQNTFVIHDLTGQEQQLNATTASFGVVFSSGKDLRAAHHKADIALKLAKGKRFTPEGQVIEGEEDPNGRNQVRVYGRDHSEDPDVDEFTSEDPGK